MAAEELDRSAAHSAEPPAAVGVYPAAGPKTSEPSASAVKPPELRLGIPAPPSASAAVVPRENLRRIPVTLDPISTAAAGRGASLDPLRVTAGARVFGGLQLIQNHTQVILQALSNQKLPASLIGALHQPDGTAAARVQLQFTPASIGAKGAAVTTLTADDGSFTIGMPLGADVPTAGLNLTVHGANGNAQVTVAPDQVAANGVIGVAILPQQLSPLPVSILAALQALAPAESPPAAPSANGAAPTAPKKHAVTIGESNSLCQQTFAKSETTDRFPWGLFFRIVEPQMSIVTQARQVSVTENKNSWLAVYQNDATAAGAAAATLIDRTPIDQPLSVDGFRDQVAGVDSSGYFTEDETVPMAASLGLGYILRMAQQWKFKGLGIGDLIYSLPLAPGEQQQIAVFERQDTTGVTESETFSQAQTEQQTARADTSTNATFHQSFGESVNAGSSFNTSGSSASAGVSFGIGPIGFGGGGGSSSSSGTSNSSLSGTRDTTAQAAQATHSSAENTASAHLSAQRTGMRLASASENMGTTTKIITNHNHTHALTMQYWEVQRMYDVSTTIEGLTLVCLIPMQVVRFMPPGQPVLLSDPSTVDSSAKVMERYKYILRHLDTLTRVVPWQFQRGLQLLAQFAADPTTIVDSSTTTAETVIKIELEGSFLSCERIFVSAVTKRNTRVGPVQLAPSIAGQPSPIPLNVFGTRDELTAWLTGQRQGSKTILQGSLAVPPSVNRSDIIGFEIGRQFNTVTYTLTSPLQQAVQQLLNAENAIQGIFGDLVKTGGPAPLPTVVLGPADLDPLLGGPTLARFYAAVENFNSSGTDQPAPQETYANDSLGGVVLPAQPFPVPALQIAPVLRYQDVLEIERSAQHVVRNTARYSKDVWLSLTPDETAILLDGHTIGVPPGGLTDASQMIPLLNCLQNTILGTYGNSLMMPLVIPQDLADQAGIEPDKLQQALLDYQREAFVSPHSTIALPTRGVVGEAILGSCPSAEKIDITRFWNWQDAPADTAPGIGMVQLPTTTPSLTTGVTAPNSLTNLPPLINNLITAPQPNTGLLQAMGQQASSEQDFSPTLTGQQQLSQLMQGSQTLANQARSDALKTSQTLASQSMKTMSDLVSTAMKSSTQTPGGGTPSTGTPSTGTPSTGKKGAGQSATTSGTQATQATQTGQAAQATASDGSSSDLSSVAGQVLGAAAGAAAAL